MLIKTPKTSMTSAQHTRREELTQTLSNLNILGEITTWMLRENRGLKNVHTDVINALKTCGLDEKMARKFLPTQAFSRACSKLKEERVIDVIRDDKDDILFQFSKRQVLDDREEGGQEFEYRKEVKILLNKTTGDLTCKDPAIEEQAKKELDRCTEERTTSDVSFIATKLFETNADLIPIGTGVYFVPLEHLSFADKVHNFLKKLGRKMQRFPVPAGTQQGDQSVQEAMESHLEGLLESMDKAVKEFTVVTRMDTVGTIAKKVNSIKEKIKAYSTYLKDKSDDLLSFVDKVNERLVKRVEEIDEERKLLPPGSQGLSNRQRVFNCLSMSVPKSIKELCAQAGTNTNGIGVYLDKLVEDGRAVKTTDGYKLATQTDVELTKDDD